LDYGLDERHCANAADRVVTAGEASRGRRRSFSLPSGGCVLSAFLIQKMDYERKGRDAR
jgi:hypothetical protein